MSVDQQLDEGILVRKAVNLFTFLVRTQQLLVKPVRTVESFEEVVWFSKLPTIKRSGAATAELNSTARKHYWRSTAFHDLPHRSCQTSCSSG